MESIKSIEEIVISEKPKLINLESMRIHSHLITYLCLALLIFPNTKLHAQGKISDCSKTLIKQLRSVLLVTEQGWIINSMHFDALLETGTRIKEFLHDFCSPEEHILRLREDGGNIKTCIERESGINQFQQYIFQNLDGGWYSTIFEYNIDNIRNFSNEEMIGQWMFVVSRLQYAIELGQEIQGQSGIGAFASGDYSSSLFGALEYMYQNNLYNIRYILDRSPSEIMHAQRYDLQEYLSRSYDLCPSGERDLENPTPSTAKHMDTDNDGLLPLMKPQNPFNIQVYILYEDDAIGQRGKIPFHDFISIKTKNRNPDDMEQQLRGMCLENPF